MRILTNTESTQKPRLTGQGGAGAKLQDLHFEVPVPRGSCSYPRKGRSDP